MSEPTPLDDPTVQAVLVEEPPLLTITVYGIPGPQGSKTPLGGGRMRESSAKVRPWRDCVSWRAIEARNRLARKQGWVRHEAPCDRVEVRDLCRRAVAAAG